MDKALTVTDRELAVQMVRVLDERKAWEDLQSKDVPGEILVYVSRALVVEGMPEVRKSLGMESPADKRWKKIMAAMKSGLRVDGTGIFLTWLRRNEAMAEKVNHLIDGMLETKQPFSKMMFEGINTMANLQLTTIKMGRELGIFMDAKDQVAAQGAGGNGGVTIVVQTNVPLPSRAEIEVHQKARRDKNDELIAQYKPVDVDSKPNE